MMKHLKAYIKPVLSVFTFLAMQGIAGMLIALCARGCGMNPQTIMRESPSVLALCLLVSSLLTIALLGLFRMIKWRTFSPRSLKWKFLPLGVTAAILGVVSMDLLSEQLHLPDLMKMEFEGLAKNPWGIVALAVVGPIVEELVFREAIIGTLLRRRCHRWEAIVFSALVFGLCHGNPAQIPFAFVIGIIFGIIYVKTGSIVVTGLLHILNNTLAVVEINVLASQGMENFSYSEVFGEKMIWYYIVGCGILSVVFLTQFWKKYHRKHTSGSHSHSHHTHSSHPHVLEEKL